ncbi:hypothetical protein GCM10020369_19880 [Cryptosporangium minutisporangium]|uniref:Uncharacterized protein n=1 Tax=Cryptosporangium minutisporangium TaxID=113569 RepID=A0ABP6SVN4_9ACTN
MRRPAIHLVDTWCSRSSNKNVTEFDELAVCRAVRQQGGPGQPFAVPGSSGWSSPQDARVVPTARRYPAGRRLGADVAEITFMRRAEDRNREPERVCREQKG